MYKDIKNITATIILTTLMLLGCMSATAETNVTPTTSPTTQTTPATPADEQSQIDGFIDDFIQYMVDNHNFDADYLYDLFDHVTVNKIVINQMNAPFEAKPWFKYREFFLVDERIQRGVHYWQLHADTLSRAEKKYGVPASIIVSILGVETDYGKHKGEFSVLESLSTLAFNYPSRADFFKKELESFLLMTREQNINPLAMTGSRAGAIGLPQFMPSSYRRYAVDFSGKNHIDLINNDDDAIGSVGNYLYANGWIREGRVAEKVGVQGMHFQELLPTNLIPPKPAFTVKELTEHGIILDKKMPLTEKTFTFFDLQGEKNMEYWIGYNNYYVISRYNRNKHYVMAVYQLSDEIAKAYKNSQTQSTQLSEGVSENGKPKS